MDQPKIERLLRLMKFLTGNNSYTISDLSNKLDMSVRMLFHSFNCIFGSCQEL